MKQKSEPKKTGYITAKHPIYGGKAQVLRFRHCGDAWYFRMWIPTEKKFVQHSLKTKDFQLASEKAEKDFIGFQAKVQQGEKIFSFSASELVEMFLVHLKERFVDTDQLSQGRYSNVKIHLKHYLDFIHKCFKRDEPVQNIKRDCFRDYVVFRRKENRDMNLGTIRNEQITIRSMYKWALELGHLTISAMPIFEKMKIPLSEGKREGISLGEYRRLYAVSKNWHTHAPDATKHGEQWYYRRLLHDLIIVMANFGFRTGEVRSIRWKDVQVNADNTAKVLIRAEYTKVREERTVTSRRGDVFDRIRSYSKYTEPNDFVLSAFWKNRQWNSQMIYRTFRSLVKEVREKYGDEFDAERVLYGLRHLFITIKLRGGATPWAVAHMTGTSPRQITATYNDVTDEQVSRMLLSVNVQFDKDGNLIDRKGHVVSMEGE